MSSFLIEKKHIDVSLDCSLKENLNFSIKKIKKLFPLHLITMIPFVVFSIFTMISKGITFSRVIFLLLKILLNITLLQTWFPYDAVNRSLNGVAWFLSAMLFLFFIYPLLRKITQNMKLWLFFIVCCSVLFLQILICIPFANILGFHHPVYIWFSYFFPIFRIAEFLWGICIARFLHSIKYIKDNLVFGTVLELIVFLLTILCIYNVRVNYQLVIPSIIISRTTVLLSAVWVFLFSIKKGLFSLLLTNRLFVYLGNISQYMFLIHFVVTYFTSVMIETLNIHLDGSVKTILTQR